jgi:hypothetical protein
MKVEWRIDARVEDNLGHPTFRSTAAVHRGHQLSQLVARTVRRAHRRERTAAIVRVVTEWMHVQCQTLVNSTVGVQCDEELQAEPEPKAARAHLPGRTTAGAL